MSKHFTSNCHKRKVQSHKFPKTSFFIVYMFTAVCETKSIRCPDSCYKCYIHTAYLVISESLKNVCDMFFTIKKPQTIRLEKQPTIREWSSESGHQRVVMCVMFDPSPWIILTVISLGNKLSPHSLILIISHQQPQRASKTSRTSRTSRTRRTRRTSRTMNNLLLLVILTVAAYQSEAERKINSFIVL